MRFDEASAFERYVATGTKGVAIHGAELRSGEVKRIHALFVDHSLTYLLAYEGGCEWGPAKRRGTPGAGQGTACTLDGEGGSAGVTELEVCLCGLRSLEAIKAHLREFDDEVIPPFLLVYA